MGDWRQQEGHLVERDIIKQAVETFRGLQNIQEWEENLKQEDGGELTVADWFLLAEAGRWLWAALILSVWGNKT